MPSLRTVGFINAEPAHPYPYPRSPPVAPQFILSTYSRRSTPRSSHLHTPSIRPRSFSFSAGQRRNGVTLDMVDGKPQFVLGVDDDILADDDSILEDTPVIQPVFPSVSDSVVPSSTLALVSSTILTSSLVSSASLTLPASSSELSSSIDIFLEPSSSSQAVPTSSQAAASSSYTHAPQFYIALALGLFAGLAFIIAVIAFYFRRRRRIRLNEAVRFPWDTSSDPSHKPVHSELGLDVDDLEKRGGVGEPKRTKSFWSTPLSLTSIFNAGDTFNTPATALGNFAGVGIGRVRPPSPIPTHSRSTALPPFVDISLSPGLMNRPRINSSGTLGTFRETMGELKVTNYVPGDSLYASSGSSSRASSALRVPLVEPIQGLPLPGDYGIARPERALKHRQLVESGRDGSPGGLVDRLRQRHQTAVTPVPPGEGDGPWAEGWRSALSFVSPYLYQPTDGKGRSRFTPAPKRLSDPTSLGRRPTASSAVSRSSLDSAPSVYSTLTSVGTSAAEGSGSLRRTNGTSRKKFVVRGGRSQRRSVNPRSRSRSSKETGGGASGTGRGGVGVGLGIHGFDKREFILFGDAEDEDEEEGHVVVGGGKVVLRTSDK